MSLSLLIKLNPRDKWTPMLTTLAIQNYRSLRDKVRARGAAVPQAAGGHGQRRLRAHEQGRSVPAAAAAAAVAVALAVAVAVARGAWRVARRAGLMVYLCARGVCARTTLCVFCTYSRSRFRAFSCVCLRVCACVRVRVRVRVSVSLRGAGPSLMSLRRWSLRLPCVVCRP